jgi:predicted nucleotidyltransferase component of viral defense system
MESDIMEWSEIVSESERIGTGTKSIMQEELQKAVLTVLSQKGCFQTIVFQGGTALRLFYNNPRFSEDIDLVLRQNIRSFDVSGYFSGLEHICKGRYPFLRHVGVRTQKQDANIQRYIVKAVSDNIDIRLHIELATIPSYDNTARILNYPPNNPAIRVEEPLEILADKVRALAYRPYLKGRDLWDIHFLMKERSAVLDWDLVKNKVDDYAEPVTELGPRLERKKREIISVGSAVLDKELQRFMPSPILEGYRDGYDKILSDVVDLISTFPGGGGADESR